MTYVIEWIIKAAVIMLMGLLMGYGCAKVLDRQAHADYQKCLSWQTDGYDVRCGDRP